MNKLPMIPGMDSIQREFQAEVDKYKKLQKKYQKLVSLNGQLDTQLNENLMVQEELTLAKPDSKVYKLTGKVLVPQPMADAKSNVERRMKFIEEESKRNNDMITTVRQEISVQREKINELDRHVQNLLKAHLKPEHMKPSSSKKS